MSCDKLEEIQEEIRLRFGLRVDEARPIRRGYLNEKWILRTNRGEWFAKSFHPDRYGKFPDTVWDEIAQALRMQMAYFRSGGPCPELLGNEEQGYLHRTPSGRKYVVMTCCPGDNVRPGRVTEKQMHSLGIAAGEMHRVWNDGGLPGGLPLAIAPKEPVWKLDPDEWKQNWEQRRTEVASASAAPDILEALEVQKEIIDRLDLESWPPDEPGWSHLDLWTENILFEPDRLTAIVDFDRVRYAYPALDLGRAVLSCALAGGEFRRDAAAAFAEGYRQIRPLPGGGLLHAVRRCWLIESFWWIRSPAASWSTAPRRFQQEMIWTAAQWDRLETSLGNLDSSPGDPRLSPPDGSVRERAQC
ncbi:phosphotransferase [Cohnella sp. CFH 77786]|uniref:phosphotransferase n=1 Tax=Cohnella sp. CFH 77786 TaxID=2662265 RepID=UPI001C60DB99|nr:phosphotransferase [Cohnella sp. CFH 77786]MBW5447302.1 phosphotransferase [Cohnella sp. CFH 77786]